TPLLSPVAQQLRFRLASRQGADIAGVRVCAHSRRAAVVLFERYVSRRTCMTLLTLSGIPLWEGANHETPPPKFSASGRRRCRAAGFVAFAVAPRLSYAAGALDRSLSGRRRRRSDCAADRAVPVGAPGPAGGGREQARRRRQYRHRVRGQVAARRL